MSRMTLVDFSYRLKKRLWSDEVLALIPHFGWNDGGCRSLMKAFVLWFDSEELRTYQIVKSPDHYHSEHAFVRIGDWFLDGDGVSGFNQMEHRWLYEEGLARVIIREFDPDTEPVHTNGEVPLYIADDLIEKLVRFLDEHFDKNEVLHLLET